MAPNTIILVVGLHLALTTLASASSALGRDAMRAKMLRTYFQCPVCDSSACPDVSMCVDVVKEPGICGCCFTCALGEGDPCGMYTDKCGQGLKCKPAPGDPQPLQSLLDGNAMCVKSSGSLFAKLGRQ